MNALLRITLDVPDTELLAFEWREEGKSYREWLVPADWLNKRGKVEMCTDAAG